MRFTVLLTVVSSALATLFERQAGLPSCAVTCLANTNTGTCAATNEACLCTNQAFINSALACMNSSCSSSDFQTAEAAAEQLCLSAAGVTLTASSATPTASATATATATAAAAATSTASHSSGARMIPTSINVLAGAVVALAIAAVL